MSSEGRHNGRSIGEPVDVERGPVGLGSAGRKFGVDEPIAGPELLVLPEVERIVDRGDCDAGCLQPGPHRAGR